MILISKDHFCPIRNKPEKQLDEYLSRSISAPWLETNPSGCVKINQLGADEDGLLGIILPHTTFQIEILEISHFTDDTFKCSTYSYIYIQLAPYVFGH